jgi:hypothetical protein
MKHMMGVPVKGDDGVALPHLLHNLGAHPPTRILITCTPRSLAVIHSVCKRFEKIMKLLYCTLGTRSTRLLVENITNGC